MTHWDLLRTYGTKVAFSSVAGCKVTGRMLSRSEITSAARAGEHCRKSEITLYADLEVRGLPDVFIEQSP
jgi:hypothetical protein